MTPPTFAAGCSDPGASLWHAQMLQELGYGFGAFALLEAQAPEFSAYPFVQPLQVAFAFRMAEERHPTGQERIEFADHLFDADASVASGDLPKDAPLRG